MEFTWEGAAKLLSAGPLGLGAIVVMVTGTILMSGSAVEQGRLKLALSMLLAGVVLVLAGFGVLVLQTTAAQADAAAKFAAAQASTKHQVFFRVDPVNSNGKLPKPEISVNNVKLDKPEYTVQSDITVIVDVTQAFLQLADSQTNLAVANDRTGSSKRVREQLSADIDTSIAQLQRIVQLMSQSCPGGSSGVNPFHYADIVNLSNSISGSLQKTKGVLGSEL